MEISNKIKLNVNLHQRLKNIFLPQRIAITHRNLNNYQTILYYNFKSIIVRIHFLYIIEVDRV